MNKLFLFYMCVMTYVVCYGQTSCCSLYINELQLNDTLKINLNIWQNRNHTEQKACIYKSIEGKYFIVISNDTLKNFKVELNSKKLEIIKKFEIGVRNQKLEEDNIIISALAEYELSYRYGRYYYSSKREYYNLFKELLK